MNFLMSSNDGFATKRPIYGPRRLALWAFGGAPACVSTVRPAARANSIPVTFCTVGSKVVARRFTFPKNSCLRWSNAWTTVVHCRNSCTNRHFGISKRWNTRGNKGRKV